LACPNMNLITSQRKPHQMEGRRSITLPASGDLLDVRIPYARVIDRRFLDAFLARVAQITLEVPHYMVLPSNAMAPPKDAVSEVLTDFTIREAMKLHAAEFYTGPKPTYDSKTATLKATRR
jgi:hypothetical protein